MEQPENKTENQSPLSPIKTQEEVKKVLSPPARPWVVSSAS